MPVTSDKMRTALGLPLLHDKNEMNEMLDALSEGELLLKEGHKIGEPMHLLRASTMHGRLHKKINWKNLKALNTPPPVSSVPLSQKSQSMILSKIDLRGERS